ncbi:TIGR04283 family arsenosugar biosynthesis glycosyltransferase [Aquidulcibacter sp.]|uniref:TIGR04283 family arsenosugar biosynthesis glycosyltransferase n=1 Tax=Aquidulcibacter sp. TaxID=2052990 RepID=UPI0025C4580E|nr:TIGR04283 family arsenosugar biosynthesis glycosyltransferase [Aquidulcibacter sp.]MCA3695263.1 TIGR04283 family arsenosugar biosynthesis glycosyltransferase [Aquidulcibacter sp.]
MTSPPLSIVIPTLNAMPRLADCLATLVAGLGAGLVRDVVVVDASSSDQGAELALDMGCTVLQVGSAGRGRGQQLAAGAIAAKGDWILFLHGDSVPLEGWIAACQAHIATAPRQAAYFRLDFDAHEAPARRTAFWANWRARLFGLPYGDQGLLISRSMYEAVGGFQPIALMEDVDLVRKLGKARLRALPASVQTSAERYRRGGWWFVPLRNIMLLAAFLCGISPDRIKGWYR